MNRNDKGTKSSKKLINQPIAIQFAMLIGKVLPRKFGLWLASLIGTILGSNQKNPMVKAIRANQWVIHNKSLTEDELEELPKIIFQSAGKCLFDYFYFLTRSDELQKIVDFSPNAKIAFNRIWNNEPCVIVCLHMSNFDLMGHALALNDIEVQVLSYPDPNASYKLQNQLRENIGMTVTPMSLSAFRQARNRLREGGSVLTGLDRPVNDGHFEKYHPVFFNHKANLPVTYVRMAKEANAPVIVLAATSQPEGRYCLEATKLIWMEQADDLETEILHNANRVLNESEGLVREYAHQWAMFYPVWPQFLGV